MRVLQPSSPSRRSGRRPRCDFVLHPRASQRRPWCRRAQGRDRPARRAARADAAEAVATRDHRVRRRSRCGARRRAPASPCARQADQARRVDPPDPEALGVSRRQFFNRATVSLMGASLGAFAAAAFVAFLWPSGTGGFGGRVTVGKLGNIIRTASTQGGGLLLRVRGQGPGSPSTRPTPSRWPSRSTPTPR
jgi:hypothetical protein